jgi:hypothetical protein
MSDAASHENAERTECPNTTWAGLPGTDSYHPTCHWSELCKARGCFWQTPEGGPSKQQRGLDL